MSVFWLSGISMLWLTAVDIEFDSFLCLQIFERKKALSLTPLDRCRTLKSR